MMTAPARRPRVFSRIFGLLLAVSSITGQIALSLHNHPLSLRQDGRASFSHHREIDADANCRLCALSVQSRAAYASAPALVIAPVVAYAVSDAPSAAFGRTPSLRPSSRAPPAS